MRFQWLVAAAALAVVPAASTLAQQTAPGAAAPAGLQAGQVRAKALFDRDLYSSDGVEIGEVEDLILDAQGRAVSAVIEVESRLGFTEKYIAVPYTQVSMDGSDRKRATVAMTRDQLRALPGMRYQD